MDEILILQLLIQLLRNMTIIKEHNSRKLVSFTTQLWLESNSQSDQLLGEASDIKFYPQIDSGIKLSSATGLKIVMHFILYFAWEMA